MLIYAPSPNDIAFFGRYVGNLEITVFLIALTIIFLPVFIPKINGLSSKSPGTRFTTDLVLIILFMTTVKVNFENPLSRIIRNFEFSPASISRRKFEIEIPRVW